MSHSVDLWENTRIPKDYPVNRFDNYTTSPNTIMRTHWHEHFEFVLAVSGELVFYIDGLSYPCRPGDILCIPCGSLHSGYSVGSTPSHYYAIVFNPSLLQTTEGFDPLFRQYIAPVLEGTAPLPNMLPRESENFQQYTMLLQRIITEIEHKKPGFELIVKSLLGILLMLLAREFPRKAGEENQAAAFRRYADRFKPLLLYAEHHFHQTISVDIAARLVHLSPFHFCKMFKKTMGCTWIEYLQTVRVREAMRLLVESNLPITEIAGRVGFGTANYFTRIFKKQLDVSPLRYRQQFQP